MPQVTFIYFVCVSISDVVFFYPFSTIFKNIIVSK